MKISMLGSFMKTLTGPCAVREGDAVLSCCSGGVDSMVLLDLLTRAAPCLGIKLGAVHVDHGIRGEASHRDSRFVEEHCAGRGITCHVIRLSLGPDTPNLEEEARLRRYRAVRACMAEHGYQAAAAGHTMNDQAETLVHRLIRGSGVRGLAGMEPRGPWGLIRPLLHFSRQEVEEYADLHGIAFVEDLTNKDTNLVRNLIRHEIIPVMEKINPSVLRSVCRLSEIARREGALVEDLSGGLERRAQERDWGLVRTYRCGDLLEAPRVLAERMVIRVLSDMLGEPRGIDASQVEEVMRVVAGEKRAHTLARRVRVQRDGGIAAFFPDGPGPHYELRTSGPGIVEIAPLKQRVGIRMSSSPATGGIAVRSLLPGDRIEGQRAVRLLAESGVAAVLRPFWPVLVCEGRVVSVVGIRDSWPEAGLQTEFSSHG